MPFDEGARVKRSSIRTSLLAAVFACCALSARAQDLTAGASATAGLTFNSVDSFYVGPEGPYLKEGLGGLGYPAASMAIDAGLGQLAVLGEVSYGALSKDLTGRLVPGGGGRGRARDTLLSLLAGPRFSIRSTRLRLLGGVSRLHSEVSVDDVDIDPVPVPLRRTAFTVGVDASWPARKQIDYMASVRVTPGIERSERAKGLGAGHVAARVTFGIRVALTP